MKFKPLQVVPTIMLMFVSLSTRAEEPPSEIEFVRPLGMGGAFTAVADDHNIFNFNPAGMVQRTGAQVTLLEIAGGISEDTLDAIDFVSDNEDKLTNYENLTPAEQFALLNEIQTDIASLNPRVNVAADVASFVSGPSFLGLPVHVGFGALGVINSSFRLDAGVLVPNLDFDVNNDVVIPISLAKRWEAPWIIPGRIGVGLTAKAISRRQVKREDLSVLQLDDIEEPPIAEGRGVGADVGLLYQPTDRFNFGLMIRDAGGTRLSFDKVDAENGYSALRERDTVIRPRTNMGIAIVPETLLWLLPTTDRWTFALDVRDVFNHDEHVFFENGFRRPFGDDLYERVHMGAEFRYWFFRFRGGAYQGYPSFGLGLDIPFLKLDYAYYSRELGDNAGDLRQGNHIASFAIRFGSGATESRERIEKAKSDKRMRKEGGAEPMLEPADTPVPTPKKGSTPPKREEKPTSAEDQEYVPQ